MAIKDRKVKAQENNSKFLTISTFVIIAVFAFIIGLGAPIAYLIHKGEYNCFDDYLKSVKKSKETDQFINSQQNTNGQQKIQINNEIPIDKSNIPNQSNEPLDEENIQELQKQQ